MNKRVALLSMDSLKNFYTYDKMLIEPMNKLGWNPEEISWRNEKVNWDSYNAVIVRSTWDYQNDPEKFFKVLEKINNSSAHLENNLELMKWNMDKKYLYDLEKTGIRIVDTIWEKNFSVKSILEHFKKLNTSEIIIKPNISANADNTFRLSINNFNSSVNRLEKIFGHREFMIQPFLQSIIKEGEYSLFYFNGKHSHSVLKKPKVNDFRVQEEHGGMIKSILPKQQLMTIAQNIINKLSSIPLYARIDLVRNNENEFALIELELIEPSLYFNRDKDSAERFAIEFSKRMENL